MSDAAHAEPLENPITPKKAEGAAPSAGGECMVDARRARASNYMTQARRAWAAAKDDNVLAIHLGHAEWHYEGAGKSDTRLLVLGENLRLVVLRAAMRVEWANREFARSLDRTMALNTRERAAAEHENRRERRKGTRDVFRNGRPLSGTREGLAGYRPFLSPAAHEGAFARSVELTLRKMRGPGDKQPLDGFRSIPFAGADAPDLLLDWLISPAVVPRQVPREEPAAAAPTPPTSIMGRKFLDKLIEGGGVLYHGDDDRRRAAVAEIEAWIAAAGNGGRVLCVHAPGMATGMTALATHLFDRGTMTDVRPWLYLPVSRGHATSADASYRSTVARLAAFLEGGDPTLADPEDGRRSTEERLASCRRAIAAGGVVILLDGYQGTAVPGATPHLSALVRDEPVGLLLERLLRPRVDVAEGTRTTEGFERSRIVVLGNLPVAQVRHLCDAAAEPFPGFPETALRAVLRGTGMDRPGDHMADASEVVAGLVEGARTRVGETPVLLMRALIDLAGRDPTARASALDRIRPALLRADPVAALVPQLAERLRGEAGGGRVGLDYLAFGLLAASDTGIRPGTLGRIVTRLSPLQADGSPTDWAMPAPSEFDPQGCLSSVREVLRGLVVEGDDEVLASLHDGSQGLEYNPPRWFCGRGAARLMFEMPDLRLRETVLAHLRAADPFFLRTLHLLLADESFQQHAVTLRHSQTKKFLGLRYHRRLVEGIRHGLLSLGKEEDRAADGRLAVLPSSLPAETMARVSSLYCVHLRQGLEHAPDWHMSRMFGANAAKAEILSAFLALPQVMCATGGHMAEIRADAARNLAREQMAMGVPCSVARPEPDARGWAKLEADARLNAAAGGHTEARAVCEHRLEDLGVPLSVLTVAAADLREASAAELDAEALARVDASGGLAEASRACPEILDLIERIGMSHVHAHEVDPGGEDATGALKLGYLWFRMARLLATRAPGVNRRKPSGSSSRVFVRCCLGLAAGAPSGDVASRALYLRRARQSLTRLAFRMFRYPSERAAALILEAGYARLVANDPTLVPDVPAHEALRRAANLLQRAEDLLPGEADRPRLHVRFLAERAHLSLAFARAAETDGAPVSGHIDVLRADLAGLDALVARRGPAFGRAAGVPHLRAAADRLVTPPRRARVQRADSEVGETSLPMRFS